MQYLAGLVFIVSTMGIILTLSFVLNIAASLFLKSRGIDGSLENWQLTIFGPSVGWLVVSPVLALLRIPLLRHRSETVPLSVIRFMGSPARASIRAWDGIFFGLDRRICRILTGPLLWLLRKPHRFVIVAVAAIIIFLLIAYGLLMPSQAVAWANQYGRGIRFFGGASIGFMYFLAFVIFAAMVTFFLFVTYVWLRAGLAAVPVLAIYVMAKVPELAEAAHLIEPVMKVLTYLPPGFVEVYENPPRDSVPAVTLYFLARIFVGSIGFPTTIGMITVGLILGWLPYLMERLNEPTPREVIARHGWKATIEHVEKLRAHRVVINALWGGGLVVAFFGMAPLYFLLGTLEKNGGLFFNMVILPVATSMIFVVPICRRVRKSGRFSRLPKLDMSVEGAQGDLGAPEWIFDIDRNFTPLGRLLSEAQRKRNVVVPAATPTVT